MGWMSFLWHIPQGIACSQGGSNRENHAISNPFGPLKKCKNFFWATRNLFPGSAHPN